MCLYSCTCNVLHHTWIVYIVVTWLTSTWYVNQHVFVVVFVGGKNRWYYGFAIGYCYYLMVRIICWWERKIKERRISHDCWLIVKVIVLYIDSNFFQIKNFNLLKYLWKWCSRHFWCFKEDAEIIVTIGPCFAKRWMLDMVLFCFFIYSCTNQLLFGSFSLFS